MNYNKQTTIAVVGVSHDASKYGNRVFTDLVKAGYSVAGTNPKGGDVAGKNLYSSLEELVSDSDEPPELAIFVVPPEIGITVIANAKDLGITNVWLQPGAESEEIIEYAQEHNIHLVDNQCFMTDQGIW